MIQIKICTKINRNLLNLRHVVLFTFMNIKFEVRSLKVRSALDLFHYSLFFSLSSLLLVGVFRWSHMVSESVSGWLMGVSPQHKSGGPAE